MTPAELKAKWIEELRSGRYRQARGKLIDGDALCCLGVLCEVLGERPTDPINFPDAYMASYMVNSIAKHELIKMNDGGKSFTEIADWVEAHDLQTGEPL